MARLRYHRVISDDEDSELSGPCDEIEELMTTGIQGTIAQVNPSERKEHQHEPSIDTASDKTLSSTINATPNIEATFGQKQLMTATMTKEERANAFEAEDARHKEISSNTSEDLSGVTRVEGTTIGLNGTATKAETIINAKNVREHDPGLTVDSAVYSSLPPGTKSEVTEETDKRASSTQGFAPLCSSEPTSIDEPTMADSSGDQDVGTRMDVDQESKTLADCVKGTSTEMDVAKEAEPKQPSLAELIVTAVGSVKRNTFKNGDMAVVIDIDDLSKTLLLSYNALVSASGVMKKADFATHKSRSEKTTAIEFTYVIHSDALEDVKSTLSKLSAEFSVKDQIKIEREAASEGATATATAQPTIDWTKAYKSFFSVITGATHRLTLSTDAIQALPQIEGVIAIATQLDAIPSLSAAFNISLLDYINNSTLWAGIAKDAASWLLIGLAMKNSNVYDEAFRHLAGLFPEWPWNKSQQEMPQVIMVALNTKSRDLRFHRYDVDQELFTLSLQTEMKIRGQRGFTELAHVSQSNEPCIYSTLNIWRDWISEHLAHLYHSSKEDYSLPASVLCDHNGKDCLTVAGVYSLISKGGDAYLPAQNVLAKWNKAAFPNYDETEVRENLGVLKVKAAKIVAPLVASTLQYAEKEKLEYLTCIKVDKEERPWVEVDQGDDVEMED